MFLAQSLPDPDVFYNGVLSKFLPNALAFATACLSTLVAGLIIRAFVNK